MNNRWIVDLASAEYPQRLPLELLELATKVDGEGGSYLIYRDSLTAFKAGQLAGAVVRPMVEAGSE